MIVDKQGRDAVKSMLS